MPANPLVFLTAEEIDAVRRESGEAGFRRAFVYALMRKNGFRTRKELVACLAVPGCLQVSTAAKYLGLFCREGERWSGVRPFAARLGFPLPPIMASLQPGSSAEAAAMANLMGRVRPHAPLDPSFLTRELSLLTEADVEACRSPDVRRFAEALIARFIRKNGLTARSQIAWLLAGRHGIPYRKAALYLYCFSRRGPEGVRLGTAIVRELFGLPELLRPHARFPKHPLFETRASLVRDVWKEVVPLDRLRDRLRRLESAIAEGERAGVAEASFDDLFRRGPPRKGPGPA